MRKLILSVLFIIIGGGFGFAGAYFHPAKWQVVAQLEAPKMSDLGNYFSLYSTYSLVSGDADAVDMTKLEKKATQAAFDEFKKMLNSPAQLSTFLGESNIVKARAMIEQKDVQSVISQVVSHFNISSQNDIEQLMLSSFDRQEVDQLFVEYVRYANNQARKVLNNELIEKWKVLFQQVKKAADAKIDASWENKLKMMQTVQPLDNNLVAFHFVQQPNIIIAPKPYLPWVGAGAGLGLLLSVLAMLILGSRQDKKILNAE